MWVLNQIKALFRPVYYQLPVLFVMSVIEVLSRSGHYSTERFSILALLLLAAVLYTAMSRGLAAGMTSAALAVGFTSYYVWGGIQAFHFGDRNFRRIILLSLALPPIAFVVGRQKERNDRLLMREREARRLAEEAADRLSEREERFRLLVQNSFDIITIFAPDGTIIYQSQSIYRVLGCLPEERMDKNIFRDPIVHREDMQIKSAAFRRALATDEPVQARFRLKHRYGDWRAEEVRAFAPGLRFEAPNGPCFAPDGTLFVPEVNRVRAFPGAAARLGEEAPAAAEVVPQGRLIPASEENLNHGARVCRVGPDDKLYVSLGQPYDVPPPEKLALYERLGIGGIVRMGRDGRNREVFARGVRNSVGLAFRPGTGELWFTDTDSNGLGEDLPPGEINRATAPGLHFGFPWYGGGRARTEEYRGSEPPAGAVFPAVETAAHATDLGLAFYEGALFPPEYRGALFGAQHGSVLRRAPVGARVVVTFLAPDGSAREHRPFAEGWLDGEAGRYRGRPVDVAVLPDGSLLVSDDQAGALYRVTYGGAR